MRTNLSENDFYFIHWEEGSGEPELFELIIDGKSKSHCMQIKQQIIDNQKIKKRLENKIKENQETQKSIKSKLDKMDELKIKHGFYDINTYDLLKDRLNELAADHQELLSILNGESQT